MSLGNNSQTMDTMSVLQTFLPEDEDDDNANMFKPVVSNIRFDLLPTYALSVRKDHWKSLNLSAPDGVAFTTNSANCTILSPPLFGSYHIVFVLKFSDGLQWVLKVPATGYRDRFTEVAARALTSEALTMRLLKSETTVPVPEVYSFNSSLDNAINCPFILMEFIVGISLSECWFDNMASKASLEQHRIKTLQDLARVMVQLNKFVYSEGGAPLFDKSGKPAGVGPLKQNDISAMWNRPETDDPFESAIHCEVGPFSDPKSFLLCMLDRRDPPTDPFDQGIHKLLRLFVDWIPSTAGADKSDFVLSHPDYDSQNVLVSSDGKLCGLIDWDGVAIVPRYIGNERYPGWLTRDWDPAKYDYRSEPDVDGYVGYHENSPKELAVYRSMYLEFMEAYCTTEDGSKLTRNSIIIESLKNAADEPICTVEIVEKIYNEIICHDSDGSLTELPDDDDRHLYDIACALAEGDLDHIRLQWIKNGFEALFA